MSSGLEPVTASISYRLAPNPGPMTLEGTNSFLIRGRDGEPALVVDPGPAEDAHLRALASHGPIGLIALTHHHPDHAEGAMRLRELTGAAVTAYDDRLCVGSLPLRDGQRRDEGGVVWEVLHTPGHSADSVSLLVESDRALLTGDTVLGRGTTVVAHPDGRLGDYLASLHRLHREAADRVDTLLPGHGPVGQDPLRLLEFYLQHRRERLDQVSAALAELGAGATPMDVVRLVYADVDPALWPAAELSVKAQLDYLAEQRAP